MRTEVEVRRALEKRLGRPVSDALWGSLVEDGYIREVLDGEEGAFAALVKRYRRLEKMVCEYQREGRTEHREAPPDRRALLVSRLLAQEASQLPEVKRFRRQYLPDGLLALEQVGPWIKARAEAEGKASEWVAFPIPEGHEVKWGNPSQISPPLLLDNVPIPATLGVCMVEWINKDGWTEAIPVKAGGVLDRLRVLSEQLAREFHWREAQATTFVLTGKTPLVPSLRVEYYRGSYSLPTILYQHARITLDVDPEVPPSQVAKFYAEARRKVRSGQRNKPLSEKVAALVEFVLEHGEGAWREKVEAWNRLYPKWAYRSETQFARDYHRAVVKLLRPPKW